LREGRKMRYSRDIGNIRNTKESGFYLDLKNGGLAPVIVTTKLEIF